MMLIPVSDAFSTPRSVAVTVATASALLTARPYATTALAKVQLFSGGSKPGRKFWLRLLLPRSVLPVTASVAATWAPAALEEATSSIRLGGATDAAPAGAAAGGCMFASRLPLITSPPSGPTNTPAPVMLWLERLLTWLPVTDTAALTSLSASEKVVSTTRPGPDWLPSEGSAASRLLTTMICAGGVVVKLAALAADGSGYSRAISSPNVEVPLASAISAAIRLMLLSSSGTAGVAPRPVLSSQKPPMESDSVLASRRTAPVSAMVSTPAATRRKVQPLIVRSSMRAGSTTCSGWSPRWLVTVTAVDQTTPNCALPGCWPPMIPRDKAALATKVRRGVVAAEMALASETEAIVAAALAVDSALEEDAAPAAEAALEIEVVRMVAVGAVVPAATSADASRAPRSERATNWMPPGRAWKIGRWAPANVQPVTLRNRHAPDTSTPAANGTVLATLLKPTTQSSMVTWSLWTTRTATIPATLPNRAITLATTSAFGILRA